MTILDVFALLGGVAFFLFGMNVMSASLEKMSGGRLERTLNRATSSKSKSIVLGMGITIAIQSSSAMTVMLVGLVNSGIMELHQTVGVIMGSNIGTTLTAWILALAGIESDNIFIRMLKPENFSPLFAVVGIALIMFSKKQKRRDVGEIFIGFAVLMFGMVLMGNSVKGLSNSEAFTNILIAFENPFLGVLVGALFTGIIQSSAASVGLLQTFALTVGIKFGVAIPIIMGQNIGTCVTALLSSIGVNRNARRVAVVHISFNIIGTILYFIVLYGLHIAIGFKFMDQYISPFGIAVAHSIFNVSVTAALLPFTKMLERLAYILIPDREGAQTPQLLDDLLLNTPAFALVACRDVVIKMSAIAQNSTKIASHLIGAFSERESEMLVDDETTLDSYEDTLSTYLVKLFTRELTDADSYEASRLLRAVGDLERIGDHAINMIRSARELDEKQVTFSPAAQKDLQTMREALGEILDMTVRAFTNNDHDLARQVEPLEQVIDVLVREARDRHIVRIQRGECKMEQGFIWTDILVDFERVSDHCSNIAVALIQSENPSLSGHDYLAKTRSADNAEFTTLFNQFDAKYRFAE